MKEDHVKVLPVNVAEAACKLWVPGDPIKRCLNGYKSAGISTPPSSIFTATLIIGLISGLFWMNQRATWIILFKPNCNHLFQFSYLFFRTDLGNHSLVSEIIFIRVSSPAYNFQKQHSKNVNITLSGHRICHQEFRSCITRAPTPSCHCYLGIFLFERAWANWNQPLSARNFHPKECFFWVLCRNAQSSVGTLHASMQSLWLY